uniref:DRBM domain-containing protein n=1 Tax=Timema genevievae TaxID=629358 RepID=A0A7R9JTH3_TIMGE|nr:unnamed protein product [Timema genevievae]
MKVSQQRPNAGTENLDLVKEDDYKSTLGSENRIGMLQEICQRMKWEMPVYIESGFLNHEQGIKCTLRGITTEGFNINKKDAKKIAAGKMLANLNRSGERFTSHPAKSNLTYASEHAIPINATVSNSCMKSIYRDQSHPRSIVNTICDSMAPKTVKDSTSKTPPDLAKVIELFRSLKCPKTPIMSSKPDVIEEMHLKFQFQDGVILNEIVQAFNYEEQEDIDYLLLLEKLSKEQHFVMQFKECKSLDPNQAIWGSGSPWASHFTVTFSFSFALCTTDVSMKEMGSGDKRTYQLACRHFLAVNIGLAGVVAFIFLVDAFKHEIDATIPIFGFGLHVDSDKERTTLVYDQHIHKKKLLAGPEAAQNNNNGVPTTQHHSTNTPGFYNTYLPFLADTSVPPLLSHIIRFPLLEHVTNRESLTFLTVTGAEGCKTIASLAASTTPAT